MPGTISKILRKPSVRTQLEATITGLVMFFLISLTTTGYIIFFSDYALIFKILTGIGEIAISLMLFANLATTYAQLYALKMSLNLYPPDIKLMLKVEEAKVITQELIELINKSRTQEVDFIAR